VTIELAGENAPNQGLTHSGSWCAPPIYVAFENVAGRGAFGGRLLHMTTNAHRSRPTGSNDASGLTTTEEYQFANSVVTVERGPVGAIARVETGFARYYAGPLPQETLEALAEVATNGN